MTRILVFYPSNQRNIWLETTILNLRRRGVDIELLTTCGPGPLHEFLTRQGIDTHTHPFAKRSALAYYARQIRYLVRFCRERGITTVFSNLQHANLIAGLAQYFVAAKVVLFRHHFKFVLPGDDIPLKTNRNERIFDTLINRVGKTIVVPSTGVDFGMRDVGHAD